MQHMLGARTLLCRPLYCKTFTSFKGAETPQQAQYWCHVANCSQNSAEQRGHE